jgi:hypothetical protein
MGFRLGRRKFERSRGLYWNSNRETIGTIDFPAIFLLSPATIQAAEARHIVPADSSAEVSTTGWTADQVRVQTTAQFVNPAGCSIQDGYLTSPSDPGNHAHQAALLAAYTSGFLVQITVSNTSCTLSRPQIIGVTVVPN